MLTPPEDRAWSSLPSTLWHPRWLPDLTTEDATCGILFHSLRISGSGHPIATEINTCPSELKIAQRADQASRGRAGGSSPRLGLEAPDPQFVSSRRKCLTLLFLKENPPQGSKGLSDDRRKDREMMFLFSSGRPRHQICHQAAGRPTHYFSGPLHSPFVEESGPRHLKRAGRRLVGAARAWNPDPWSHPRARPSRPRADQAPRGRAGGSSPRRELAAPHPALKENLPQGSKGLSNDARKGKHCFFLEREAPAPSGPAPIAICQGKRPPVPEKGSASTRGGGLGPEPFIEENARQSSNRPGVESWEPLVEGNAR
jgi:hypothetical protein